MTTPSKKHALRVQLKARRTKVTRNQKHDQEQHMLKHLDLFLKNHLLAQQNIAVYLANPHEPSLDDWIQNNLTRHPLFCPKKIENRWQWAPLRKLEDVSIGPFGIREPKSNTLIQAASMDCFLVPGLGFDLKGNRLGYGKGVYDQLLADTKGVKIGICYEEHMVDAIPKENHDIQMDYLLTETRILKTGL